MFSLNIWVGYINVQLVVRPNIPMLDEPKRFYKADSLTSSLTRLSFVELDGFYRLFTDGSKDRNCAGAAFYDPHLQIHTQFKISSALSIMHIELLAIVEALSYVQSLSTEN